LTVDSEFVASYLQERLDIVKEMRKLGKLWNTTSEPSVTAI
jgi:hypothetical protein